MWIQFFKEGEKMKFLDLFAGIGGFRLGLEQAGHECVGYVEWDKFARKSYEAIHNTEGEWTAHDITSVTDDDIRRLRDRGQIDIICGGFPCQAFSVAGKRKGFDDTRGTLFFEIARFANIIRPRYLFLENVKGLLNHDRGVTFEVILRTLDELGYDAEWQVLNSKNFGVPQNRERVFIIGHSRRSSTGKVFPVGRNDKETNNERRVISLCNVNPSGNGMNGQIYDSEGLAPTLTTNKGEGNKVMVKPNWIPGSNEISKTLRVSGKGSLTAKHAYDIVAVLTPDRVEKSQNGRRIKDVGEPMFTLTAQDRHGIAIKEATKQGFDTAFPGDSINYSVPNSKTRRGRVGKGIANTLDTGCQQGVVVWDMYNKNQRTDGNIGTLTTKGNTSSTNGGTFGIDDGVRIRKLTPRECWRLQSYPNWAFDKAAAVNSDSQLYKQAGNSVTVNVIEAIGKKLF